MDEFHRGPYETAVGDGEMLIEVRVPLHDGAGSAYEKVERRVGDWAVAAAGAAVWLDGGTIADAGIALTAVGADVTSTRAEESLAGQAPSEELFADGRRHRRRGLLADRRPARPGRVQAPPGAGADAPRAAPRGGTGTRRGGVMQVTVTVNGEEHSGDVEPRLLLVHFLRDDPRPDRHPLGLRHVQLRHLRRADGRRAGQVVHRARGDGRRPRDHAPSRASSRTACSTRSSRASCEEHGLQCGFCTPGMMLTARALLDRNPDPTEEEIREAISGQICRCTGYANIVRSVRWAAEHATEEVTS